MPHQLASGMRDLMVRLNVVIDKYEKTVAEVTKELNDATSAADEQLSGEQKLFDSRKQSLDQVRSAEIDKANAFLSRSKYVRSSAKEHLNKESVSAEDSDYFRTPDAKEDLSIEADRHIRLPSRPSTRWRTCLSQRTTAAYFWAWEFRVL